MLRLAPLTLVFTLFCGVATTSRFEIGSALFHATTLALFSGFEDWRYNARLFLEAFDDYRPGCRAIKCVTYLEACSNDNLCVSPADTAVNGSVASAICQGYVNLQTGDYFGQCVEEPLSLSTTQQFECENLVENGFEKSPLGWCGVRGSRYKDYTCKMNGECTPPIPISGVVCQVDSDCAEGLYCNQYCTEYIQRGSRCVLSEMCVPGTFCDAGGTCAPQVRVGEQCDPKYADEDCYDGEQKFCSRETGLCTAVPSIVNANCTEAMLYRQMNVSSNVIQFPCGKQLMCDNRLSERTTQFRCLDRFSFAGRDGAPCLYHTQCAVNHFCHTPAMEAPGVCKPATDMQESPCIEDTYDSTGGLCICNRQTGQYNWQGGLRYVREACSPIIPETMDACAAKCVVGLFDAEYCSPECLDLFQDFLNCLYEMTPMADISTCQVLTATAAFYARSRLVANLNSAYAEGSAPNVGDDGSATPSGGVNGGGATEELADGDDASVSSTLLAVIIAVAALGCALVATALLVVVCIVRKRRRGRLDNNARRNVGRRSSSSSITQDSRQITRSISQQNALSAAKSGANGLPMNRAARPSSRKHSISAGSRHRAHSSAAGNTSSAPRSRRDTRSAAAYDTPNLYDSATTAISRRPQLTSDSGSGTRNAYDSASAQLADLHAAAPPTNYDVVQQQQQQQHQSTYTQANASLTQNRQGDYTSPHQASYYSSSALGGGDYDAASVAFDTSAAHNAYDSADAKFASGVRF